MSRSPARESPGAPERAVCFWSSGKDSAMALAEARVRDDLEVVALLTTIHPVPQGGGRVAVHRVHESLVERQATALGLPLVRVELPDPCPNPVYEAVLAQALETDGRLTGVTAAIFGDLFLADIRAYRELLLTRLGLRGVFPLWSRDTTQLARRMIDAGIRARLTVVDTHQLPARFVGRHFDESLLEELPAAVDPCGENGEFHTFVTAAPGFAEPIRVEVTAVAMGGRLPGDRFATCDLRAS